MTNNWVITPINKFCKIVSGSTPKTSEPTYWGGDIAWVTPMDLSKLNNKYITNGARNITRSGLKSCSTELIPANSLVMSSRAPIGYFAINKSPVATNQGCKSFVCDDSIDIEFLYYALNQHIDSIKRLGSGSTFAEVGKKQIGSLIIQIPSKAIQQKIAAILSSVDEAIQKTDKIIQKSEELKNGLMNELLTKGIGHKKFKKTKLGEIPEEWEIVELNQITHNITDGKHGDCKNESDSSYYFVSVKDIRNGQIDYKNARQIKKEDFEDTHKRTKLEAGDLLLTNSGTIGRMAVVSDQEITKRTTFQKSVAVLKPNPKKVDAHYLMYALTMVLKSLILESSGSAQKNLLLKDLRSYMILLPSLKEQKIIAEIVSDSDNKITQEKEHKYKLSVLKNGLMNDIFSQKVQINI